MTSSPAIVPEYRLATTPAAVRCECLAPRAAALMQQVERIDAAHNAYADQARTVFALLGEGRRRKALAAHSEADFTHGMCSGYLEQMRQRISAGHRPSAVPAS